MTMATNLTWIEKLNLELQNRPLGLIIFECLTAIIINILAAFGNLSLCIVIFKTPSLQTKTNIYITALGISGTLQSLTTMPLTLGVLVEGRWIYGSVLCNIQGFTILLFGCTSLQTMALIALNRYFCVVKPSLYRRYFRRRHCIAMIVAVWIVSSVVVLAPLVADVGEFAFRGGRSCCWLILTNHTANLIYTSFASILLIFLPFVTLVVCYVQVFRTLHQHSTNLSSNLSLVSARDVKTTKQLFALVVAYGVCWIPGNIIELVDSALTGAVLSRTPYMVYVYLSFMSDAINPILYGIVNQPFRRAFVCMFCNASIVDRKNRRDNRVSHTAPTQGLHMEDTEDTKEN